MTPHRTYFAAVLLMVWSLTPAVRRTNAQELAPLLVVMAQSAGVSNIDSGKLRRVFQGFPTEENGNRLVPFNQIIRAGDRTRFDKAVLGFTPEQVGRYWIDQRIRQVSVPPRTVPSTDLLLRVVASLPGAISYVALRQEELPPELRALTVDGKTPGALDYPLHSP